MVTIIDCLQCRTLITRKSPHKNLHYIMETTAIFQLILLSLYILTLIPAGDDSESSYEELSINESPGERSSLLSRPGSRHDYGGFAEDNPDPNYLGIAKDGVPWLSKVFFYWVGPLIKKGELEQLKTPDDVFDVPNDINTVMNSERFHEIYSDPRTQQSILRALYKIHGKQFFMIGGLKFFADCAGFASPLLLNAVVNFMEDPKADTRLGYW